MNTLKINAEKDCMMIYNEGMSNGTKGKLLNNSEMNKLHKECKSAALEVFDDLPDLVSQQQIKNAISQCSKMIEASDYMSRMEEKVKMQESTRISQAKDQCMEYYNNNMRKVIANQFLNNSEMEKIHKEFTAAALEMFDNLPNFVTQEQIKNTKDQCSKMMDASEYKFMMDEKLKRKLHEILELSKNNYRQSLRSNTMEIADTETFERQVSICRENAITAFKRDSAFGDTEITEQLLELLRQVRNVLVIIIVDPNRHKF
ncbi:hypothetical protein B566_EDAN001055 [Ephemera danica]|nr:hypothetical protein B566_EDAN001055 [Ephemera danica]